VTERIVYLRPDDKNWGVLWRKNEEAEKNRQVKGSASLSVFRQRSRLRPEKSTEYVAQRDREKIACALYLEIERLEKHPELCAAQFSRKGLMQKADIAKEGDPTPTKRMRELTLHPDKPAEDSDKRRLGLCASYDRYIRLIDALISFSREDEEEICIRIFSGTSFSGIETDINKNRGMVRDLESKIKIIDKMLSLVSKRMTLGECFRESARLKERAQKDGSTINWPYFDLQEPYAPNGDELPNWESPYWSKRHEAFPPSNYDDIYHRAMISTCLDWYHAILYLPRIYLGCAIYFPSWLVGSEDTPSRNDYLRDISQSQEEIAELRPLITRQSVIVFGNDKQEYRSNSRPGGLLEGDGHCWLVIYPSLDGNKLCPMFYWSQGEGGVHVCILNDETIDILSNFHIISAGPVRVFTVFEHLSELLDGGAKMVEIEWARTAFDLLDSPFLRECAAGR
jgi:hypothetical protein